MAQFWPLSHLATALPNLPSILPCAFAPQDRASRFATMVAAFCERLGWHDLEALITKFQVGVIKASRCIECSYCIAVQMLWRRSPQNARRVSKLYV